MCVTTLEDKFDFVGFESTTHYKDTFNKARHRLFNDHDFKFFENRIDIGPYYLQSTDKKLPVNIDIDFTDKKYYFIIESLNEKGYSPSRSIFEKIFGSLGFPLSEEEIHISRCIAPKLTAVIEKHVIRNEGPSEYFLITSRGSIRGCFMTKHKLIDPGIIEQYSRVYTKLSGRKI